MTKDRDISTLSVHAGQLDDQYGAAVSPLYDTTTFSFSDTEALLDVVEGRKHAPFYTRYGMNPTITSLEQRLAALDGAETALAYASGMAAISSVCLAFGRDGIICLGEIYGGTTTFLQQQAATLGLSTQFLPADDNEALEQALAKGASLILFETPANPTMSVIDIKKLAAQAHRYQAKVMVDNTFATPINQRPLALGADFAVQSATKFLGGHSDLTAGVVSGNKADLMLLNEWRKSLGQTIAPEIAHKLKRSLVTLPLRIERHNHNAQALAEFLQQHPGVEHVYYPGLKQDLGYELAITQMSGFGGMLSFDVKGGDAETRKVVDNLALIKLAPSLGGAETLATQPVTSSHHGLDQSQLAKAGIHASMVRLSVGLEDKADLIDDLNRALSIMS